jgi:G3E family GTPase
MPPLPVTVLTGFLGAGKTTLLIRLLREPHEARLAVVINEVGLAGTEELEVDEASFLELTEGCVCCVRATDLVAALGELSARGDVDRVVIETTGIADPLALTFVLERPDLTEVARLDAVVTVVDALNWRRTRVAEWDAQVGAADLLVLAKTDLAPDTAELRAVIAELNPAARILDGADLPLQVVLDIEGVPRPAAAPARHSSFAAVSITDGEVHDRERLEDLLEGLPAEVYRAKGIVSTEAGWVSFHVVGGRVQIEPAAPPAHRESRVVFLGKGIADAQMRKFYTATKRSVT